MAAVADATLAYSMLMPPIVNLKEKISHSNTGQKHVYAADIKRTLTDS